MRIFNGLNKENILGILDNDKHKIGNFLYGTTLKVYNPSILEKLVKPCVILRAGSYNKEIKKQLFQINKNVIVI